MEMCWTYLDGLTSFDAGTPLLALDLRLLDEVALAVASLHEAARIRWCPATPWGGLPGVASLLQQARVTGVCVSRVDEAVSAIAAGMKQAVVATPPVVGRQPERFADLCRRASMTVVCDHFAQAERIAAACRAAETEAGLLLRVDVGRHRLGVRPGPDLSDLAEGVGRLSGVRLAGIWVGGPPMATGVGGLGSDELGRLLSRCLASLQGAGYDVPIVSVSRIEDVAGDVSSVTEARTPISVRGGSAAAIVAGVVGRPTRDQAVVDAGRDFLGRSARVAGPPGLADVAFVGDEFTVLRLAAERQDLAIGDVVALLPEAPQRPRSGQRVLVHDRGAWRIGQVC